MQQNDNAGRWVTIRGNHVFIADAPRGTLNLANPSGVPPKEDLSNPDIAFKAFHRELKKKVKDGVLTVFHESFLSNLSSIEQKGLLGGDSAEDTVFATIGRPSEFVTSPEKLVIEIGVPSDQLDLITPDMRYGSEEGPPEGALLREHSGVDGADIAINSNVPRAWIRSIRVVRP